jgi:HAE1 family hydrophobic/amphiphilic exporter-1
MFETYIRRPVLSLVISIFITLLGLLSLFTLPITQFPDIVPPSVVVTANYTGANAEVSTNAVAIPLERAINGVAGMTYMNSVSTNNGTTLIQVFFKVGTDPDIAAVNVQNRVTTVLDELPEEVIKAGVTTEKEVNSMLMYLNLYTDDPTADERFIYNFADINILKELKRIEGVGFAQIMGAKDYAMRIWVKPDRLSAYSISTEELITALRRQNIEAAPGQTGISSDKARNMQQFVLKYPGKFTEAEEYAQIPIRANADGTIIRIGDVADVEFGSLDYEMVSKTDGQPSASIMLKQLPGSNAQEVIQRVKDRMEELKTSSFPPGMTYTMGYDVSRFLDASISKVMVTLLEAFLLVFLVVFIFLQNFRATLIPILAVPVCLIGALFFMQMMGFSINLLTLFALVLAIGIVVDNGIVVVEAVYAKMEEEHLQPLEATLAAMKEVGTAVIAITLVMSAVFIPVAFLSGPVGIFYRQFSLTLAASIIISGVNALTLTPALCALILKSPHDQPPAKGVLALFFKHFNRFYERVAGRYKNILGRIAGRRVMTMAALGLLFVATFGTGALVPSGFIPTEDQGMIYVAVTTPPGATVDRTETVLDEIDAIARSLDMVETVSTLAGYSIVTEVSGASYGMGMINLKPWDDRKEKVDDVIRLLQEKTAHIADATIEYFPPPTVPGFGNSSGFELRLLDKTTQEDLAITDQVVQSFLTALENDPVIESASTTFDIHFPQYLLEIDYDLAAKKGISVENAMGTLQTLLGSQYATNFIRYGQMYKVMVQSDAFTRQKPEDLLNLYVKTDQGEMVPYASFMQLKRVYGPEQITRYNMFNSAMITGQAAAGYSSGQAIEAVEKLAEQLPQGYEIEWSGMTREQKISGNQAAYIFLLCLVFVYLLLAAQYESFLLPLPVILCLPAGVFGSFLFLYLFGLENNIYAQVALVMLIGLLGKNAILIVEFANLRRKQGHSVVDAAIEGAVTRLRPILMTSFAFAAGLIPLMVATGAGAIGNQTIGTASVGGMVVGTVLGVLIIPGLVVLVSRKEKINITKGVASLILIALVSSCSLPKKITTSELPQDLTSSAERLLIDTSSLSQITWSEVLTDPQLVQLIQEALERNIEVRQATYRMEMAQAQLKRSRAGMWPWLQADITGGLTKYGHYTEAGIGNYDTNFSENLQEEEKIPQPRVPHYGLGLQASWEIDLWGKLRHGRQARAQELLSAQAHQHLIQSELISTIAQYYFELIALDQKKEVLEENIQLHERALAISIAKKDAGRADELAVQQFRALLFDSKAHLEATHQEITSLEHQLNLLVGRPFQKVDRQKSLFEHQQLYKQQALGSFDQLIENRPDIQMAKAQLMAAFHDSEVARLSFLPSIAISPFVGLQSFSLPKLLQANQSVTYGLLGGLTFPLFHQRELKTQYEMMKAQYGSQFAAYEYAVLDAVQEIAVALSDQTHIQRRMDYVVSRVEALSQSSSIAEALFIAGRGSYLDIIEAQRNHMDAQLGEIDLKKESLFNQLYLYKVLGGGW